MQGKTKHSKKLYRLFRKYASNPLPDGTMVMTIDDFIKSLAIKDEPVKGSGRSSSSETLKMIFSAIDNDGSGYIDFNEFKLLVKLLTKPESEIELAFKMIDREKKGTISRDQFKQMMSRKNSELSEIKFNFNCDLMDKFFGKDESKGLSLEQFKTLMNLIHQEMRKQQFEKYANNQGEVISKDFAQCLREIFSDNYIPDHIQKNIQQYEISNEVITSEDFDSFNQILSHLEGITDEINKIKKDIPISPIELSDFSIAFRNVLGDEISPEKFQILFKIFGNDNNPFVMSREDFNDFVLYMTADRERRRRLLDMWIDDRAKASGEEISSYERVTTGILKFATKVAYGGIAGGIGATFVYPIDLVKTRMQNQRNGSVKLYANSIDCFKQVWRHEGFLGFYRGLGPQLIGVAPEKSIKLVTNEAVKELIFGDDGTGENITTLQEIIAGGSAGASQVIFTNPLEIVKIRLQIAGEIARKTGAVPKKASTIVRELGFTGLYKGASACFARDIPFSAIYFPLYNYLKTIQREEDVKTNTPLQLMIAGSLAGSVAASSTTPFDVIKTRLQVETTAGQKAYSGIFDAARSILKDEGPAAFMKGCIPRIVRSSPQFGVTLLVYELLHQAVPPPHFDDTEATSGATLVSNVPVSEEEQELLRKTYASSVLAFSKRFGA